MRISDWSSDVCSSDLVHGGWMARQNRAAGDGAGARPGVLAAVRQFEVHVARIDDLAAPLECTRSEEHTSELQSLMRISYAVFCLKKKKSKKRPEQQQRNNKQHTNMTNITRHSHTHSSVQNKQ